MDLCTEPFDKTSLWTNHNYYGFYRAPTNVVFHVLFQIQTLPGCRSAYKQSQPNIASSAVWISLPVHLNIHVTAAPTESQMNEVSQMYWVSVQFNSQWDNCSSGSWGLCVVCVAIGDRTAVLQCDGEVWHSWWQQREDRIIFGLAFAAYDVHESLHLEKGCRPFIGTLDRCCSSLLCIGKYQGHQGCMGAGYHQ